MTKENHKIDAHARCVFEVLNQPNKYTVDYFQREYRWEQRNIEQLVEDLTDAFLDAYTEGDARTAGKNYGTYYLGPFVVSSKEGGKSIIDGQQRLTSLTLFLIFLNNLQKDFGGKESIEPLVFSDMYGDKSFNIQVEERKACLESLFRAGSYEAKATDDESTSNMAARYADIARVFPEEINAKVLPYFLDWLKYNVILVEIIAYSDDNAYAIFESMNDRGLNLTPSEMLKGFILSRFAEAKDREKANQFWKDSIQRLRRHGDGEDNKFFPAWFKSQFADTIRQSKAGAFNEDFEKTVSTRFHTWFRDNLEKVKCGDGSAEQFRALLHTEMDFYLRSYLEILSAQRAEISGLEHVFYHAQWGIADSLSYPLMLAPLRRTDSNEAVRRKINEVARFMETFAVRRAINFRKFAASSIRYTMYSLVKEIRGKDLESLKTILNGRLAAMEEGWSGVAEFRLHGMNRQFVKFLLARITAFIEQQSGMSTSFTTYFATPGKKPYEVEHIWANKFDEHRDEFEQQHEFENYRNRIGDLILLPKGTNQSYGAISYSQKVEHYLKENLLAQSLHPMCYERNPNFTEMTRRLELRFGPHGQWTKADIDVRHALIQRICKAIWSGGTDA